MSGYKIVYREPDGTIKDTFLFEPMSSFRLRKSSHVGAIKLTFCGAYPNCEIISIKPCTYEDYMRDKQ